MGILIYVSKTTERGKEMEITEEQRDAIFEKQEARSKLKNIIQ